MNTSSVKLPAPYQRALAQILRHYGLINQPGMSSMQNFVVYHEIMRAVKRAEKKRENWTVTGYSTTDGEYIEHPNFRVVYRPNTNTARVEMIGAYAPTGIVVWIA